MTLVKDVEYVLKTATGLEVMRAPRKSDLHRYLNENYPFETVKGESTRQTVDRYLSSFK